VNNSGSLVKLNPLKHHLGFLKARIESWKKMEWAEVYEEILEMGNNQFDMYTGTLSADRICAETGQILCALGINTKEELHEWLGRISYRSVRLSDGSKWIIRESESPDTPAHVHPARYQQCVKRLRSTHLKTAVALMYENKFNWPDLPDQGTGYINSVRSGILGLSPVRSVDESRRILETVRFLANGP
jgi:hypothetical protein